MQEKLEKINSAFQRALAEFFLVKPWPLQQPPEAELLISWPIHVVTFALISILVTDYIQKRRGPALLSSSLLNIICCLI